jgi:DNA-binding phage protein
MKRKASISHDKAIVEELRRDPEFAAEYLRAALEDTDEPKVLLVVLRHCLTSRISSGLNALKTSFLEGGPRMAGLVG